MKRRSFLKTTFLSALSLNGLERKAQTAEKETIKSYRPLGKTGLKMSDISFGGGGLDSYTMVLRAIDKGINYFDTAPDYGSSEETIGKAMKKIQREKIILASKFCDPTFYPGHLSATTKKEDFVKSVENSLKRMKTDYLDLCFVHAMGEMSRNLEEEKKRLFSEEMFSAVDSLKKSGKIRFLAVSSHGPNNMEELLMLAVKSGKYDVIMPSFNFLKFPKLPEVMKEAHRRGVGMIAMKTLAGAKNMKLDPEGEEFSHAAFKWVLKHEEVSGLIVSIDTIAELNEYVKASGEKFSHLDQKILNRYALLNDSEYCRTGCNACEEKCPHGVEIATILRCQMYFQDYAREKNAMKLYARIDKNAERCLSCDDLACVGACPHNLNLPEKMAFAHHTLSLIV